MQTKKYLYAAIGAQVAAAKAAQSKLDALMSKVSDNATTVSTDLQGRIDVWAGEGEKFLGKVTDTKAIDELTSKVDFDQVQTQVNKLRDQLEDIVATWRANFRPEVEKVKVEAAVETTEKTGTTASKPAAKTASTKTTAAKKPAAKTSAAKKPAAKGTAAKKPAAGKTGTTKATSAKAS